MNGQGIPAAQARTTPKDVFLNISIIVTLYVTIASWLHLWFQIINTAFPDRLDYGDDPFSGSLRFAVASLIIVFPVFLLLGWLLHRDYRFNPEKREMGIRRWLVYLTLFVAGGVLAGDLIALVNTFLGGEITTRFVLKVLVVFLAAGAVFGYYLADLRRGRSLSVRAMQTFFGLLVLVVLGSMVAAFVVIGSPQTQRYLRLDRDRIDHLSEIQWQTINFWQSKERLPQTLTELEDPLVGFSPPQDPETGEVYAYRVLGSRQFELCATFRLASSNVIGGNIAPKSIAPVREPFSPAEDSWRHPAGRHCFDRTIDPDRYPPFEKRTR